MLERYTDALLVHVVCYIVYHILRQRRVIDGYFYALEKMGTIGTVLRRKKLFMALINNGDKMTFVRRVKIPTHYLFLFVLHFPPSLIAGPLMKNELAFFLNVLSLKICP